MEAKHMEYPTGWRTFSRLRREGKSEKEIGLVFAKDGDANRFASRYRYAKAFCGVTFVDGFSMLPATSDAYAAILRVTLAFTAWETIRRNGSNRNVIADRKILTRIRKRKSAEGLITFLADRTLGKVQEAIRGFSNGADIDPMLLAAGVRHIFAHGYLTANVGGATPQATRDVCNWLAEYVLKDADRRFSETVLKHQNS